MKNFPFDFPKTIMEIEIFANTIYYCIIGSFEKITEMKNLFDKQNTGKKYIVSKLNYPINNLTNDDYVMVPYIEYAQCALYSQFDNKDAKKMYILVCIDDEKNQLSYFSIELKNEIDPEDMIFNELKKYKSSTFNKKNIKLVDIIGNNDDILLYSYLL